MQYAEITQTVAVRRHCIFTTAPDEFASIFHPLRTAMLFSDTEFTFNERTACVSYFLRAKLSTALKFLIPARCANVLYLAYLRIRVFANCCNTRIAHRGHVNFEYSRTPHAFKNSHINAASGCKPVHQICTFSHFSP